MKSELRELGGGGSGRKIRQYRNTCKCLAHKAGEYWGGHCQQHRGEGKKKTGKGNELGRKVMSSSRRGRGPHMLI